MKLTPEEKFKRWVLTPLKVLRDLPDGDGAFAALSIGCGLFERFIDSSINKKGDKATPEEFRKVAAVDIGCSEEAVQRFWNGYRLGMQHAFQPKAYVQDKGAGDSWGWEMAEADGFHHYPEIIQNGEHAFTLRIDPWKFVAHVLKRWEESPDLINELSEFMLGEIAPIRQSGSAGICNESELPPSGWRSYSDPPSPWSMGTGIAPGTTSLE